MHRLLPFQLGQWNVRPKEGELRSGAKVRQLQPKVMDVLCRLAATPGELVSRDELVRDVWEGRAVSDEPLNRCIAELRNALGDDRNEPCYIETLPRRGYRLIANYESQSSHRWLLKRVALLVVGVAVTVMTVAAFQYGNTGASHRILVTPWQNFSVNASDQLLADSLTEEVINALAQQPDFVVISRTTAFSLRDSGTPARELARQVRADYLVEGSLRIVGTDIRVTVQLIDPDEDAHVFSVTYTQDAVNAAELLEKVSRSIALQVKKSVPFAYRSDAGVETLSFEDYRNFVEAKRLRQQPDADELQGAINRLDLVTARYPGFAAGHAQLAAALARYYEWRDPSAAVIARARQELATALRLDPENPLALSVAANFTQDRYAQLEGSRRAAELEPSNTELQYWYVRYLQKYGYGTRSIPRLEQLVQRDPMGTDSALYLAASYCMLDRLEACAHFQDVATALHASATEAVEFDLAMRSGDESAAVRSLQHYLRNSRSIRPDEVELLVRAWFHPELRPGASEVAARFDATMGPTYKYWPLLFWTLAGEPEKALDAVLRREPAQSDERMIPSLWGRAFDALRQSPRFPELLHYLEPGFKAVIRDAGASDFCAIREDRLECH